MRQRGWPLANYQKAARRRQLRKASAPSGEEITRRKQKRINDNNKRENRKRIEHVYEKGDKILLTKTGMKLRKLAKPRQGPCRVARVSKNGTLKIQLRPSATGTASLRLCHPFHEKDGE